VQRRIELEGCLNFRDLGGYPTADGRRVRWRRVFRSDGLHTVSVTDVQHLRDEIGLGDIIDLRSSAELHSEGRGPLAEEPIRFHHVPLFDGDMTASRAQVEQVDLADRYFLMAEYAGERIAAVIRTIAESGAPAVFHCAAGKDRTGVISAIILGLLDVPDDVVVADYAATQENLEAITSRLMALDGYRRVLELLPPDTMHANPETMIALLTRLREKYGGIGDYARAMGLAPDTVDRLRAGLLE
jgi:protein-tyrosine phosphatase